MKIIAKIVAALAAVMFLSGFTFDEEILSKCEQKHPNDFIARTVCNNNLDSEKRNQASLSCMIRAWEAIESQRASIFDILNKNADAPADKVITDFGEFGYGGGTVKSARDDEERIVISHRLDCDGNGRLIFNISLNKNHKLVQFRAWISIDQENWNNLNGLSWDRSEHLEEIATEAKKAEDLRESLEKQRLELKRNPPKPDPALVKAHLALVVFALLAIALVFFGFIQFYRTKKSKAVSSVDSNSPDLPQHSSDSISGRNKPSQFSLATTEVKPTVSSPTEQIKEPSRFAKSYDEEAMSRAFRDENPFVQVDVPRLGRAQFLEECRWFKEKFGAYPSGLEQQVILAEIVKSLS